MRVRVDVELYRGTAIDLPAAVRPAAVYDALREGSGGVDGPQGDGEVGTAPDANGDAGGDPDRGEGSSTPVVAVEAPDPGPVHEHVGLVEADPSLSVRAALAAAARSRGYGAPQAEAIASVRAELADLELPSVSTGEARRRVSEAGDRTAELDERVAELRGRIRTLRDLDRDPSEAEAQLEAAIAELTEARTERIAAEQLLERQREHARRARDVRQRCLGLEDRLGNLRRDAREHLAGRLQPEFADAVEAVPGRCEAGDRPGAFEGDPVTAALAVARIADLDAPVVLAVDRFPDAAAAADRLYAPVIRVPPS